MISSDLFLAARCLMEGDIYVISASIFSKSQPGFAMFPGKFRAITVYIWVGDTQEAKFEVYICTGRHE